jgi:hypothetical protein
MIAAEIAEEAAATIKSAGRAAVAALRKRVEQGGG